MADEEPESDYADRTFYGLLAILLLIGVGIALLMARGDASGPGLFTQDQAIIGIGLVLFVVLLIMVLMLFRLATVSRLLREVQIVQKEMIAAERRRIHGPDVIDIEGIGPVYASRLRENGIETIPELIAADATTVANQIQVEPELVREWQAMGRLIRLRGVGPQYAEVLVKAGIKTPAALAKAKAAPLAKKINDLDAHRKVRITHAAIQAGRVQGWINAAKKKQYDGE